MLPFKCPRALAPLSLFYLNSNPYHSQGIHPPDAIRSQECDSSSHPLPGPRAHQSRIQTMPPAQRTREGHPQGQTLLMRPEICLVPGSFPRFCRDLTDSRRQTWGFCTSLAQQFWGPEVCPKCSPLSLLDPGCILTSGSPYCL